LAHSSEGSKSPLSFLDGKAFLSISPHRPPLSPSIIVSTCNNKGRDCDCVFQVVQIILNTASTVSKKLIFIATKPGTKPFCLENLGILMRKYILHVLLECSAYPNETTLSV
jgi:hypothetical protein